VVERRRWRRAAPTASKRKKIPVTLLTGLGGQRSIATLVVSQFAPAQSFSFRGKRNRSYPGRQGALSLTMDQMIDEYGLPCPNYIKLDVRKRMMERLRRYGLLPVAMHEHGTTDVIFTRSRA
jgi:hypothetical protein